MSSDQSGSNAGKFWTRNRLKLSVIIQCSITIVLIVILLSLVVTWHIKRHSAFYQKEKVVCLPCSKLKWSSNEDLSGFEQKKEPDADYMTCCSLGSKILDRLIQKHAQLKHNDLKSTRIISSLWDSCKGKEMNPLNPYVKMTGLNATAMEKDKDDIIRWNSTEYEGDVAPMNSKIFIRMPGLYYVFSTLKLQGSESNSSMVHSHYVYLHSYSRMTLNPILENSKSFCETTSDTSETTSTIGGVFKLEKHDKLFVRSSHPQHLVSSVYSNVFGLYMI